MLRIPDINLEKVIRDELGKPTGDITRKDMEGLTHLDMDEGGVRELSGLEYAVNLKNLSFGDSQVSDLSPLSGLANLWEVDFEDNYLDMSEDSPTMQIVQLLEG